MTGFSKGNCLQVQGITPTQWGAIKDFFLTLFRIAELFSAKGCKAFVVLKRDFFVFLTPLFFFVEIVCYEVNGFF